MNTLSVVIPVYNEADTVEEVIRRIQELPIEKQIIVVDDASTDGTGELLKKMDGSIMVITHGTNLGKGVAVKSGFRYVTGKAVIIQDADLELYPEDIPSLLEKMEEKKCALVIGSRILEFSEKRTMNYYGNIFLTWIANVLFDLSLTDIMSGYKLLDSGIIPEFTIESASFSMEPEIVVKVCNLNMKICEVPVRYKPRRRMEGKKIRKWHGFSVIYTLLKFRFFQ